MTAEQSRRARERHDRTRSAAAIVGADPDKARELLAARLDRSAAEGHDVERSDYPDAISEEQAEEVRDDAIAMIEDVAQAYGRDFVLFVLDRKVIR